MPDARLLLVLDEPSLVNYRYLLKDLAIRLWTV